MKELPRTANFIKKKISKSWSEKEQRGRRRTRMRTTRTRKRTKRNKLIRREGRNINGRTYAFQSGR